MASGFGSSYVVRAAEGKRDPLIMSIEINNRCNLSCPDCFISPEFGHPTGEMPLETLRQKIEKLKEHYVSRSIIVAFAGKEPLFNPERLEYAYSVLSYLGGFSEVALVTNGNAELVTRNLPILEQMNGIDVSLNGGTEEDNALTRGAGSFSDAIQGIKALKERGLDVGISYLILPNNASAIPSFYKAIDATGVQRVSYSLVRDNSGRIQFTDNQASDLLARAVEQTPPDVRVLIESAKPAHILSLVQRLHGAYQSPERDGRYMLPKIVGTQWDIVALTPETGPQHMRLLSDGHLIQKAGTSVFERVSMNEALDEKVQKPIL